MKISITTPSCNSATTIEDTIVSIIGQTYPEIEHIIKDCGSTDETIEIVRRYPQRIAAVIVEPDHGIYDGINRGIEAATGVIIGNLNADDIYADNLVIETVVAVFRDPQVDCCWGDLVYVARDNPQRVVRYWQGSNYRTGLFATGWAPPHPTFFVRRSVLERYGLYRAEFKIAADYELMLRLLEKHRLHGRYIPRTLVKMRIGGAANQLRGIIRGNREWRQAWPANGLKLPFYTPSLRLLRRLPQLTIARLRRQV